MNYKEGDPPGSQEVNLMKNPDTANLEKEKLQNNEHPDKPKQPQDKVSTPTGHTNDMPLPPFV